MRFSCAEFKSGHIGIFTSVFSALNPVFVLLSVAVHAAVFTLLFIEAEPRPFDKAPSYVEIAPLPTPAPAPSSAPVAARGRPHPMARQTIPKAGPAGKLGLSDLGIQWKKGEGGVSLPLGEASGSDTGTQGFAYGSGGSDVLEQMRGAVTYDLIYDRLDSAVFYPSEFIDAGFEGTVRATLIFSKDGHWLKARSHMESLSRYLRVHIVRTLRQVFEEPLPSNYFHEGKELRLFCLFQFELSRKDNAMDAGPDPFKGSPSHRGTLGNHLYFYRSSSVIGQWRLGPLAGYGIVPSIGVDPEWFIDQVSHAVDRKAEEDPLKKYRDDPDWEG